MIHNHEVESSSLSLATSGCSSARLEYTSGGRVVAGSNPVIPTNWADSRTEKFCCFFCCCCVACKPAANNKKIPPASRAVCSNRWWLVFFDWWLRGRKYIFFKGAPAASCTEKALNEADQSLNSSQSSRLGIKIKAQWIEILPYFFKSKMPISWKPLKNKGVYTCLRGWNDIHEVGYPLKK